MPRKYTILVNRQEMPDRAALQTAIKMLGFKLTLEENFAMFAAPKYLPCTLHGEDAGFTFGSTESQDLPGKDIAISLQWGGDPREKAAAHIVATALAHATESVVLDCNNEQICKESLVAATQKAFESLDGV